VPRDAATGRRQISRQNFECSWFAPAEANEANKRHQQGCRGIEARSLDFRSRVIPVTRGSGRAQRLPALSRREIRVTYVFTVVYAGLALDTRVLTLTTRCDAGHTDWPPLRRIITSCITEFPE
jgi:hypothetical protein